MNRNQSISILYFLILLLIGCNPDVYKDDLIPIKKNIYLYHQNGEIGYSLVQKTTENVLKDLSNGTVTTVYRNDEDIFIYIKDFKEEDKYYRILNSQTSAEEIQLGTFLEYSKNAELFFPSSTGSKIKP